MNFDTFVGKLIVGPDRYVWIVSDLHSPNLQEIGDLIRGYNGKQVRITIEEQA